MFRRRRRSQRSLCRHSRQDACALRFRFFTARHFWTPQNSLDRYRRRLLMTFPWRPGPFSNSDRKQSRRGPSLRSPLQLLLVALLFRRFIEGCADGQFGAPSLSRCCHDRPRFQAVPGPPRSTLIAKTAPVAGGEPLGLPCIHWQGDRRCPGKRLERDAAAASAHHRGIVPLGPGSRNARCRETFEGLPAFSW